MPFTALLRLAVPLQAHHTTPLPPVFLPLSCGYHPFKERPHEHRY